MNSHYLAALSESLQKEFEFFASAENPNEKILTAKKWQLSELNAVIFGQRDLLDRFKGLYELFEKCQYCLMFFGVSFSEYRDFIKQDILKIMEMMNDRKKSGQLQLPIIFTHVLDFDQFKEVVPKIRYTEKPVMNFDDLKKMAVNCPGWLTTKNLK